MSSTVLDATSSTSAELTTGSASDFATVIRSTGSSVPTQRMTPAARAVQMAHRLTFHLPALIVVAAVMSRLVQAPQEQDQEEGFSVAEWVIGVAIIAALAIAVGALITTKVTDKASSINLG
ncbi:hypothetical protein [Kineococcus radiotolerans]|uniref:Uncharacterized protein n=1 Tax=Kineococcus radiotolerans (strain ATCC BAA-149 / DSM 14245 / SRS30216) TaxID=266940 RepID=A6WH17_KINRD|nr:hypothetical protein [Kineococcus radiotolerans]ABS06106.1 hypothetical protein Krad_4647 [Kineococcus radiotolerans SRS30216 = ATCC BAA-149]